MQDNQIISNIKTLGIDMINEASSGHPGIVLGAAPILYTLYANHLNINTSDSNWFNRDRFVMSAGHGSALLYATLFMCGYDLSIEDLKKFRQIDSKTPGHPEVAVTPGVDCSTGPLGQGFANAVGMALGEKILHERYSINQNESLIDFKVYALVGDGDLMEGVSYEAASLAGTLKLNNLIVLYDSNDVSLDGPTSKTFTENVRARFEAMNWNTILVKDGKDINDISKAIDRAKNSNAPTLIEVKTKIGDGSLLEGTNIAHGKPLTKEDIEQLKIKLNIPNEPFYVNEDAHHDLRQKIANRVNEKYMNWNVNYKKYVSEVCNGDSSRVLNLLNNECNVGLINRDWDLNDKEAPRDTNNQVLKILNDSVKNFVGGSADLGSSTKTYLDECESISSNNYGGANIWFGIREHAMGSILNGMALVNLRPYGSTFLSFSDYMKPAIRMSALMKLPVTYIYTHDSINIGSDGPTHQPIEQLAMLRSIPNLKVFRPADAHELIGCWEVILNSNNNPSALILARQDVQLLENTDAKLSITGGYIYYKEIEPLRTVIIATGSELHVAHNIVSELSRQGNNGIRIVSMPSVEQFLERNISYRNLVIPPGVRTIVIEAGSSFGWDRFVTNTNCLINVNEFGYSGTKDEVQNKMNFSYEQILNRIKELI